MSAALAEGKAFGRTRGLAGGARLAAGDPPAGGLVGGDAQELRGCGAGESGLRREGAEAVAEIDPGLEGVALGAALLGKAGSIRAGVAEAVFVVEVQVAGGAAVEDGAVLGAADAGLAPEEE